MRMAGHTDGREGGQIPVCSPYPFQQERRGPMHERFCLLNPSSSFWALPPNAAAQHTKPPSAFCWGPTISKAWLQIQGDGNHGGASSAPRHSSSLEKARCQTGLLSAGPGQWVSLSKGREVTTLPGQGRTDGLGSLKYLGWECCPCPAHLPRFASHPICFNMNVTLDFNVVRVSLIAHSG